MIKNDILIEYSMRVIDKSYDGIMVLEFIHKHTNFTFVVCACYLPPDNSVWGQNATLFFSNIIYLYCMHVMMPTQCIFVVILMPELEMVKILLKD